MRLRGALRGALVLTWVMWSSYVTGPDDRRGAGRVAFLPNFTVSYETREACVDAMQRMEAYRRAYPKVYDDNATIEVCYPKGVDPRMPAREQH